ncbi:hypothetical protein KAR28_01990 [Candidatus Parcubacteria bacterium]|nr:hypothetical protein [Candidatus Parcubacteria bacterium]
MNDYRKLAHLVEQLGDKRFQSLLNSDNTGKVKTFSDKLLVEVLSTEMTVGGRIYEILEFLKDNEEVKSNVVVKCALDMGVNISDDDVQHILKHQENIPLKFRDKNIFAFTVWHLLGRTESASCISWSSEQWIRSWESLDDHWCSKNLLLRRKFDSNYTLAREILGNKFISPEEIAQDCGHTYSDNLFQHFAETLPSRKELQRIRENDAMLIAGPPKSMSLLEVCEHNILLCRYEEKIEWLTEDKEKFSREDTVAAEWFVMPRADVPIFKLDNFSEVEHPPNAAEVAWGAMIYRKIRGFWLFPYSLAETSSVDSEGLHVNMGFVGNGFYVQRGSDDLSDYYLAYFSSKK